MMASYSHDNAGDSYQEWHQLDGDLPEEGNNYRTWQSAYLVYVNMQFPTSVLSAYRPRRPRRLSELWRPPQDYAWIPVNSDDDAAANKVLQTVEHGRPLKDASSNPFAGGVDVWIKVLLVAALCLLVLAIPLIVVAPLIREDKLVILATSALSVGFGLLWLIGRKGQRLIDEQAG
jgi:hypothetical protein